MSRESSVFSSSVTPFRIVFLMWAAFYVEYFYGFALSNFGIRPRELLGLTGIFIAPLLHGSVNHLVSNTVPLLFLGTVLYFFYDERLGGRVFLRSYFWTNALVWLFGRPGSNHIGASGLVYGLAFFLIFYGLFKRDFLSLFISIVILLLYGGVFYGVLPTDPRVSYESHLAGALVGIFTAVQFGRKKNLNR